MYMIKKDLLYNYDIINQIAYDNLIYRYEFMSIEPTNSTFECFQHNFKHSPPVVTTPTRLFIYLMYTNYQLFKKGKY